MQIPKSMKVGPMRYTIKQVRRLVPEHRAGRVFLGVGLVELSTHTRNGRQRKPQDVAQILWHEMTHAILHDMGHPLNRNEKFVEEFSQRLNQAIHTARF